MKLGIALLVFAAMASAEIPIEEKNTINGIQREELRTDTVKLQKADAEQSIENEVKLQQADAVRLADFESLIADAIDSKLKAYQKKTEAASQLSAYQRKSETNGVIEKYLQRNHLCVAGTDWGGKDTNYSMKKTIYFGRTFPRKPTLSVSVGGFRTDVVSGIKGTGITGQIKTYPSWTVSSVTTTTSSFIIDYSKEASNMGSIGISWIACM